MAKCGALRSKKKFFFKKFSFFFIFYAFNPKSPRAYFLKVHSVLHFSFSHPESKIRGLLYGPKNGRSNWSKIPGFSKDLA